MIMPKPSAGHSFHCPQVTVIWCEIRTVKEDLLVLHLVQDSCKIGYARFLVSCSVAKRFFYNIMSISSVNIVG